MIQQTAQPKLDLTALFAKLSPAEAKVIMQQIESASLDPMRALKMTYDRRVRVDYQHQEYPKVMYHASGETITLETKDHEALLMKQPHWHYRPVVGYKDEYALLALEEYKEANPIITSAKATQDDRIAQLEATIAKLIEMQTATTKPAPVKVEGEEPFDLSDLGKKKK